MDGKHQPATPSVEEIIAAAARAGLDLDPDEARRLQPGVRRIRAMAAQVRGLVSPGDEPTGPAVTPPEIAR